MRTEVMAFNKKQRKDSIVFYAGDVVRVHRKIKEGDKERVQVFEGMIIAIKGGQSSSPMMTVRKVSNDVGVEIVVPLFSPNIEKIELVKRAKVRKSKLYYVRDKAAKALRFTFTDASDIVDQTGEEKDDVKEETPKATENDVKEEEKAEENKENKHTK
ncbi:MAG: 50S ribosomal protein L19 [Candidatus Moraniibacteriota bacterium]|nr:MAG: 50S ribosomal protein L19 [Candidatus Moranbacteria bacterium]